MRKLLLIIPLLALCSCTTDTEIQEVEEASSTRGYPSDSTTGFTISVDTAWAGTITYPF